MHQKSTLSPFQKMASLKTSLKNGSDRVRSQKQKPERQKESDAGFSLYEPCLALFRYIFGGEAGPSASGHLQSLSRQC
jgi:hypothetical protein